jgi:hypothetical protein
MLHVLHRGNHNLSQHNTETVIQLLENVSVSLGGTVKTAVLQTALVILIATIVVIAVLTQHILLASVMMTSLHRTTQAYRNIL